MFLAYAVLLVVLTVFSAKYSTVNVVLRINNTFLFQTCLFVMACETALYFLQNVLFWIKHVSDVRVMTLNAGFIGRYFLYLLKLFTP